MKKTIGLTTLCVLLLCACTKEAITNVEASNSVTQSSSNNAAFSFNTQTTIDLTTPNWSELNSCTGEQLVITSGTWHIDVHGVINKNKVSFDEHSNVQNYKLKSVTTGLEYTGSYTSAGKYNLVFLNGLFTLTQTVSVLLTTPGGGNNSVLKVDEHITINANGVLTAWVDNVRGGCR